MNRRIFILLYSTILLVFLIPYIIYLFQYFEAKRVIKNQEDLEYAAFIVLKDSLNSITNETYNINDFYRLNVAEYYSTKKVSFFIYRDQLKQRHLKTDYLYCLQSKVESQNSRIKAEKSLEKALNALEKKYGDNVRKWVNKIGRSEFITITHTTNCSNYFEQNSSFDFNPNIIQDFDHFLEEVLTKETQAKLKTEQNNAQYQEQLTSTRNSLDESELVIFDNEIKRLPALIDEYQSFKFNGDELNVTYHIPYKAFDRKRFDDALSDVYNERYGNYSLQTGDMPYSECYGSNNSGNRFIRVEAGHRDVLITVKNSRMEVVRHVYVQAYDKFTLRISPGSYKVFFYYGRGWNPKKYMASTICGNLYGGFLSEELIQKDHQRINLYQYESISYMLRTTNSGNFSPSGSSKNEAF